MGDEKLLTLQQVADALGVSWSWTDKKIREGKIPVVKLGGQRKVSQKTLDKMLVDGVD